MSLIDALIIGATAFVRGIVGLFPTYSIPGSITDFGNTLGSQVAGLNGLFPVVTMGVCLGLVIATRIFLAAVDLIVFVYELIPFKAS